MEEIGFHQLTAGFAIVILVVLYFVYQAALPKPLPGIPYDKKSARRLLGDLPDIRQWKKDHGDRFGVFPAKLKELDTPIMQMFVKPFGRPWVVISDYRESHAIMTRRLKEFDRSNFMGNKYKAIVPSHHVQLPTASEWSAHRRLLNDTMSTPFLHEVIGKIFYPLTEDLVHLWQEKVRLAEGRPFEAGNDICISVLDVIWNATFGVEIGAMKAQNDLLRSTSSISLPRSIDTAVTFPVAKNPPAFDAIDTLTESFKIVIHAPILPSLVHALALRFWPHLRSSAKHKNRMIKDSLAAAVAKAAQQPTEKSHAHLKSAVDLVVERETQMALKEGREPDHFSSVIQDELFGFLISGHKTTAITLCWGVKFLATHQTVQNQVREALRTAYAQAVMEKRQPTIEEITSKDVPYFDAVLLEIQRCGGAAFSQTRQATVDTTILGHFIPKGTDVFMLNNGPGTVMPALSVDERFRSQSSKELKTKLGVWNDRTITDFDPERWLIKDEMGNARCDLYAGPSHPYGAGPRECFGRKWAHLEMRVVLILLLWNFEFLPAPDELSSYAAVDKIMHEPAQCFVRLKEI